MVFVCAIAVLRATTLPRMLPNTSILFIHLSRLARTHHIVFLGMRATTLPSYKTRMMGQNLFECHKHKVHNMKAHVSHSMLRDSEEDCLLFHHTPDTTRHYYDVSFSRHHLVLEFVFMVSEHLIDCNHSFTRYENVATQRNCGDIYCVYD